MFGFRHDRRFAVAALPFGVTVRTTRVEVHPDRLVARFGPWTVDTPLSNVASATVSGPYRWWKVAGPAHLSFADRGLTFATNDVEGVCFTFREPVTGIDPLGTVHHPGLTVTVAAPQDLVALVSRLLGEQHAGPATSAGTDTDHERNER